MQNLTNDELFHFALDANKNGRHDVAIGYLKTLIENKPDHSEAIFLLGAEYAQVGLFPQAIEFAKRAIELEPSLTMASFQLGILYMATGEYEQAKDSWATLVQQNENDYIFIFGQALTNLVNNNPDAAKNLLAQGIQLNTDNQALNNDMNNVLNSIDKIDMLPANKTVANDSSTRKKDDNEKDDDDDNANQLFLSAYQNEH